jgi:hypothetical protein
MGVELITKCECGFQEIVTLGSSRRDHGKIFKVPHYCIDCSSAFSLDVLGNKSCCQKCEGKSIKPFGRSEKELPYSTFGKIAAWFNGDIKRHNKLKKSLKGNITESAYCYVNKSNYYIMSKLNYCPGCKSDSLKFYTHALFD